MTTNFEVISDGVIVGGSEVEGGMQLVGNASAVGDGVGGGVVEGVSREVV
jgi:hypothetical protein